jgi:hypothetical protein
MVSEKDLVFIKIRRSKIRDYEKQANELASKACKAYHQDEPNIEETMHLLDKLSDIQSLIIKEYEQVVGKYNVIKGTCAKCGKIHDTKPEDEDWRFKCDCPCYEVFFNTDITVKREHDKTLYYCECGSDKPLEHTGMGDGFGKGFYYYTCKDCGKTYISTCY